MKKLNVQDIIKECAIKNDLTDDDLKYMEDRLALQKIKKQDDKFNYKCPYCMVNFVYFESAINHFHNNVCAGRTWY